MKAIRITTSPKPRCLTLEQAACVGVNFVTAYQGLIRCAKLQAGETLLVTGARGGVGAAALQLGQTLNAKLIAVDRKAFTPEAFEGVKLFGYVDTSQGTRPGICGHRRSQNAESWKMRANSIPS